MACVALMALTSIAGQAAPKSQPDLPEAQPRMMPSPSEGVAPSPAPVGSKAIPYEACFTSAAKHFSVNKVLLVAIAKTESGFNPEAINRANVNSSVDRGIMQINDFWLPTLSKFGIQKEQLFDACTNIYIGAWILSHNISRHGDRWKAVGAYNASSPLKQITYVNKVMVSARDVKNNYVLR